MVHFGEVRRDQPPPPPTAPMAPPPGRHIEEMERGLNNMHLHLNADQFDGRPTQDRQYAGGHNFPPNRPLGGIQPSQSFSTPTASKKSGTGSLRMYRFVKKQYPGRKLNWEIAERTFLSQKTQAELTTRIKKPSKDKKSGRSNARDIDSDDLVGRRGHKRNQIAQLIADLNYHDPHSEWHHELIELLDVVRDGQTGNLNCDKMIVILKSRERQHNIMNPPRVFDVNHAVVDVGFFQVRQDPRPVHQPNVIHQAPHGHMNEHAAGPPQHAGPSKPIGVAKPAGPSQRDGPVYRPESHFSHHSRASAASKAREIFESDNEDPFGDSNEDSNDDDLYTIKDKGGKNGKAEKKDKKGKSDRKDRYDDSDKDDKKDKKKQKGSPILKARRSKADLFDSDSSSHSDSFKNSDAGTYSTAKTDHSFDSPTKSPLFKRFFSDGENRADQKHAPKASREHHRKNPIEYVQESSRRYAKDDIMIQPASHSRRPSSIYTRQPSFHRDRPSRPGSDDFEEEFKRKYDGSPDGGRRLALFERPRITQNLATDDIDLTKELVAANLMLVRQMVDAEARARQGYERMPRYEERAPRYDDRRPRYDDRYDDRMPRYDDDRRSPRY